MSEKKLYMPEISEEEFVAHVEDEDFFKVYGNPVLIRSKDGKHDCVAMSPEYNERIVKRIKKFKDDIQKMSVEAEKGAETDESIHSDK